jgi:hypothetical protein
MGRKINRINTGAVKFLFCVAFIVLFSGAAFAHVSDLTLNLRSDIRLETVCSYNTIIGYNLYVQKKNGIESVMLTDPTGAYALRSLVRNNVNGYEIRQLSGRTLTDLYSCYSIISSTPIPDWQFGLAFKLFIPSTVVYGNPSSPCGPVCLDVMRGIQFNIRTFDHKFGDPNRGRYQNNQVQINPQVQNIQARHQDFTSAYPSYHNADVIRKDLSKKIAYDEFLNQMSYEDLKGLLMYLLWETGGWK